MDWTLAITRNREALLRIVAALCALAGLADGGALETLPRHLRNHLYRILRPAESAVRRLIVMTARDLADTGAHQQRREAEALKGGTERPARQQRAESEALKGGTENSASNPDADASPARSVILGLVPRTHSVMSKPAAKPDPLPSLPLFDPLKRFDTRRKTSKSFPRISFIGVAEPCPLPPVLTPDDPVNAERLGRRLQALKRALGDLDGQAQRYARWKIRREQNRVKRNSILRPGWPPGYRKRPVHPVDEVLRDCHALALAALNPPDTS